MESSNQSRQFDSTAFDSFDLGKFFQVLRRSIIWIILFLILGGSSSYLVVRYTKPVYESTSLIKLEFENEANTLGLVNNGRLQQDLSNISGEIEILRSPLFLSKVAEAVNYDVSYHFYGRYLTDERYGNSPFVVSHKVKNPTYYNRTFDFQLIDESTFRLSIPSLNKDLGTFRFGQDIVTEDFNFLIEKTRFFSKGNSEGNYFFIVNTPSAVASYFMSKSRVVPENYNAMTIRISLQDYNKVKARDFLLALDTMYLEYTKQAKNKTIDQKIIFIDDQIRVTEAKIRDFETYFEDFTIENMTLSLEGDIARTIGQLTVLDSQQFKIEERIRQIEDIEAQISKNESMVLDAFTLSLLPAFISAAIGDYVESAELKAEKLRSYNENTFIIQELNQELQASQANLNGLISRYKESLLESQKRVKIRRSSLEANFAELPSMGTEFNKNQRLYSLQESFLQNLRQTKMQLELTKAGTVTDGVLLSPASLPGVAISPRRLPIIGGGVAAALLFSFLFVVGRFLLNTDIARVKELEGLTQTPIVGSIPFYSKDKLPVTKLVVAPNSKSALSESLRTIRTNMEFLSRGNETRVISITSTISGEGKTFIAVNFGAILAAAGKKVCLVDLDMRRPKVHIAFEQPPSEMGISTVLSGTSDFKEVILSSGHHNLDYIPAGPLPPNPSELILSPKFKDVMASLRNAYDLVILDTPPVGLVSDAVLVMKSADLQFYSVRANYSKRSFIKNLEDLRNLDEFPGLAVVFNGVRGSRNSYGYGYGYGYGSYGYGYYDDDTEGKGRVANFFNSFF